MDKETKQEIAMSKEEKRKQAREARMKEKQLEKKRARVHSEMVAYQKKSQKKIKKAPKGAYISLRHINKIYDNHVQAVYDFNLDIEKHEFIVLVGPSGCGKSTTLRMIAGLESITAGDLFIDQTYANELHPKDRDIAMVFQSYALYPHMTVAGNMGFGLRIRKVPTLKVDENGQPILGINKKAIKVLEEQLRNLKEYIKAPEEGEDLEQLQKDIQDLEQKIEYLKVTPVEIYERKHLPKEEIHRRVLEAARILQIEEYLSRKPKALSGGQCQRVALGRAIVKNAKVFLMDEPLSNLDAKLRVAMRSEIIRLHNTLNATTIYVTHDQTEAMTMADRIVVMKEGYIQQIGTPEEIYNHPANTFVATFIGAPAMNLLTCQYKKGKVTFENGFTLTLSKAQVKAHQDFYQRQIDLLKKAIEDKEYENVDTSLLLSYREERGGLKDLFKKKVTYMKVKTPEEKKKEMEDKIAHYEKCLKEEHTIIFGVRPEDIYDKEEVGSKVHVSDELKLPITIAELLGSEYHLHMDFAGHDFIVKCKVFQSLKDKEELEITFDLDKIHLFDEINKELIF